MLYISKDVKTISLLANAGFFINGQFHFALYYNLRLLARMAVKWKSGVLC